MKLIFIYGNSDRAKREKLARIIMQNNKDVLVLIPEFVTHGESYYDMEKEIMKHASLSVIYVESLATCFELAMLNNNEKIKVLYIPMDDNALLQGSHFIEDTIKNIFDEDKIIICALKKTYVHYKNNIIPELYREYIEGSVIEQLNIPYLDECEISELESNKNLNIRIELFELIGLLKSESINISNQPNLEDVNHHLFSLLLSENITKKQFNITMKKILNLLVGNIEEEQSSFDIINTNFTEDIKEKYGKCKNSIYEMSKIRKK